MSKEENCLRFTDIVSRSLLDYFNNKETNVVQQFCLHAIDRLNQSGVALNELISKSEKNQRLEYACAILIRSVLSDALHILNATIVCKVDNEEKANKNLEDFCFSSLADSISYLVKNIRESTNVINKEQAYKNIMHRYPEFLESQENAMGEPKVLKGAYEVSNRALVNRIKKDEDFGMYSLIYDNFLYYSKYEHFGPIYHDFQENGFHEQIGKIKKMVIKLFPWLLTIIVAILRIEDKENDHIRRCFDNLVSFHTSMQEQT